MGSIAGVLIIDYWVIRRKKLNLPDLYRAEEFILTLSGWNWRAVIATLIGCGVAWGGKILAWRGINISWLLDLYAYAWFVGFGVAAITYLLLMKLAPPHAAVISGADHYVGATGNRVGKSGFPAWAERHSISGGKPPFRTASSP